VKTHDGQTLGRSAKNNADPEHETRVAAALREYLDAIHAGQKIEVTKLLEKHGAVAGELVGCFDTLDFMHNMGMELSLDGRAIDLSQPGESNRGDRLTRILGDYRIIQEVGRGGMGVVYEAQQISLDRQVALKILPFAALANDQQLQRFKNEARAAATLQHPHIVPVFAVGCERGIHYYTMQYIEGPTLAEVLGELRATEVGDIRPRECDVTKPSPQAPHYRVGPPDADVEPKHEHLKSPVDADTRREIQAELSTQRSNSMASHYRTVARWGVEAAEALAYSHENGVLHRDIKPANLLIDRAGKLWITDFGLARLEKDASMTMTGDLIGTLRFMAPEQALAKRISVDHRTDVYSLGATLYELLTLRPAFDGRDREQLLRQIAFAEPPHLRKVEHSIPAELATIVLKAMAKNPDDRYASAQDLADDFTRFLENKPILAKPPSLTERALKWSRRHRPWVAAGTVVVLVLGVILARYLFATIVNQQTARALAQSNVDHALVLMGDRQIARSRQAFVQATEKLEEGGEPVQALRQKIVKLSQELDRYEKFDAIYQDFRLKKGLAASLTAALDLYEVNSDDRWLQALQDMQAPEAHVNRVTEQIYEMLIAVAHSRLLWAFERQPEVQEGLAAICEVEAYLKKAAQIREPTKGYYWVLATCSQRRGDLSEGTERQKHDMEAIRLRKLARQGLPQNAAELLWISFDRKWGCADQSEREPFGEPFAEDEFFAAFREMLRLEPDYYRALFFNSHWLNEHGKHEAALEALNACLAINPTSTTALLNRAVTLIGLGHEKEAVIDVQRAVELGRERLRKEETGYYNLYYNLARAAEIQAGLQWDDLDTTRTLLHEAKTYAEVDVEKHPDVPAPKIQLARIYNGVACLDLRSFSSTDDHDWQPTIALVRRAIDLDTNKGSSRSAYLWLTLSECLAAARDWKGSGESLERAFELGVQKPGHFHIVPSDLEDILTLLEAAEGRGDADYDELLRFLKLHVQPARSSELFDAKLETWRERPLGAMPYVMLQKRVEKNQSDEPMRIWLAIGVRDDGTRTILGLHVTPHHAEFGWREFVGNLVDRGLTGVQLITSDGSFGREACQEHFPQTTWQFRQI
jgi:serine/threonine protein kinase